MHIYTLFKILIQLLALLLAAAVWSWLPPQAKAQTPTTGNESASATTGPVSTANEGDKPSAGVVDSESALKLREKLRAQFTSQDPKELADAACATGNEARAKFIYGRAIAVWRARELRLTDQRLMLRKQAEQLNEERTQEREKLDQEMKQIREQFGSDAATCDAQLTELIASYKPRLTQLKTDAARAASLADQSDAKLAEIRREILSLEQQSRIIAQGKSAKATTPRIVDLELDFPTDTLRHVVVQKPATAGAKPAAATVSVDQLLKELE